MNCPETECGAKGRGGYTMTELLVATAVTSLVMSQIAVALVTSQRMFESTMADMELALQSRALREKLLFSINDEGGLMNACQTDLTLVDGNKNKGSGLVFKPKKGQKNKVVLGGKKRLVADSMKKNAWLDCGMMVFEGTNVFGLYMTNGVIEVNVDVALPVAQRKYRQQSLVKAQIMNE